ncbi:MAG TPA: helix-turn-helix transcriptional regulator [Steroidobacteraceae bacterium]|nr:helix-turn-helix transcriptional regulator [Steroidobacteraceae bacterium]
MQCWNATTAVRSKHGAFEPHEAINSLGTPSLPKTLFKELNRLSDFACMVAGTFTRSAVPRMDWTACNDAQNFAVKCTQIYRPDFADSDPIHLARQRLLSSANTDNVVVSCVSAKDISNRAHRTDIYEQFNLRERWSIAQKVAPSEAVTISLLKRTGQSRMTGADIDVLLRVAPTLLAIVQRDRKLRSCETTQPDQVRNQLLSRSPNLAPRELEVCLHLLQGLTLDAISRELGLKKCTVETYRDRAYRKLDIHFRSQLFALVQ